MTVQHNPDGVARHACPACGITDEIGVHYCVEMTDEQVTGLARVLVADVDAARLYDSIRGAADLAQAYPGPCCLLVSELLGRDVDESAPPSGFLRLYRRALVMSGCGCGRPSRYRFGVRTVTA